MKYKLRAQSVVILRQALALPGWAKTLEEIYRGGKILAEVIPSPANGTSLNKEFEFEMDTPDRDTCKTAFQFGLTREAIAPSEYIVDLFDQLEFVAKPKAT